jgi:hypothetical protein
MTGARGASGGRCGFSPLSLKSAQKWKSAQSGQSADHSIFRIPTRYAGSIRTWRSTPTLHHSTSLSAAGFEDEDDDEDSLPDVACGLLGEAATG